MTQHISNLHNPHQLSQVFASELAYQDCSADSSDFKFPPDAVWIFEYYTWDGEDASCGCPGELNWLLKEHVIGWLDLENDGRTLEDVRTECLKNGEASSKDENWSIYIDRDFIEEGSDLEGGCNA